MEPRNFTNYELENLYRKLKSHFTPCTKEFPRYYMTVNLNIIEEEFYVLAAYIRDVRKEKIMVYLDNGVAYVSFPENYYRSK